MLTEKEIRALIVWRIARCSESCNSFHINHVDGQIRGLTAVLNNGVPIHSRATTMDVLDYIGVPYTMDGDEVLFSDEWMQEHGFTDDNMRHDTFGDGW